MDARLSSVVGLTSFDIAPRGLSSNLTNDFSEGCDYFRRLFCSLPGFTHCKTLRLTQMPYPVGSTLNAYLGHEMFPA